MDLIYLRGPKRLGINYLGPYDEEKVAKHHQGCLRRFQMMPECATLQTRYSVSKVRCSTLDLSAQLEKPKYQSDVPIPKSAFYLFFFELTFPGL